MIQADLFPDASRQRAGPSDPASALNRHHPIHRWVPWIAGYSASWVGDVLDRFAEEIPGHPPVVVDPFAGVGTTLVEALRRGFPSVGFEINPFACLAANTKLHARDMDLQSLYRAIEYYEVWANFAEDPQSPVRPKPKSIAPSGFVTRVSFFSEEVERKVLWTLDYISELADATIRDVFRLALGATMIKFSNYTYEPSLASRPGSGKPLICDAPVAKPLLAKLHEIGTDIALWKELAQPNGNATPAIVHQKSCLTADDVLGKRSVDLIVTSPPYLNNYHYVRNTRPQLWWLNLISGSADLHTLEHQSMGKFWQTVRDSEPVNLTVHDPDLAEQLNLLRRYNQVRGAYGGPGWANYVATYFNDLDAFADVASRLLRPGGVAVVVLGNSIIQGIEFKVEQHFARMCERRGLKTIGVDVIRSKRVGTSIVNSSVRTSPENKRSALYDAAVIMRA